jgi:hypothetical protein
MEFMRNAPYQNKKDGRGRPGFALGFAFGLEETAQAESYFVQQQT